jgi:hypothetical protein
MQIAFKSVFQNDYMTILLLASFLIYLLIRIKCIWSCVQG